MAWGTDLGLVQSTAGASLSGGGSSLWCSSLSAGRFRTSFPENLPFSGGCGPIAVRSELVVSTTMRKSSSVAYWWQIAHAPEKWTVTGSTPSDRGSPGRKQSQLGLMFVLARAATGATVPS